MAKKDEITDWRDLKVGMYVRLECGCEGFVSFVCHEGSEEWETGFYISYTVWGCSRRDVLEKEYRNGYGPYKNFFNYDLKYEALPAEQVDIPKWVSELPNNFLLDDC